MSFLITNPEMVVAAATDLEAIRSALNAAHAAAAGPMTGVLAAAADEVSVAVAALFGTYGQEYQALSEQAAAFHARFVQALTASAGSYASAEATNVSPLQGVAGEALGVASAPSAGTGGTGIAATYTVTSHWDGGFVADYTITNSGTTPLTNWQAQFDLPANESITNVWNGELAQSGMQYTLTPASWTETIAPGHSVTVGMEATQTGAYSPPTDLQVNGHPISGGTTPPTTTPPTTTPPTTTPPTTTPPTTTPPTTTPPTSTGGTEVDATYTVTSHWDGGFVADYTITNSGTTALTNWQAQFDLPANESITDVWNGELAHSGTQYDLTPASWTETIAPGHSVTVGFDATETGAYSPPTDLQVNGHPISGGTTPPTTTPPTTTPPTTTPPTTTPPTTTPPTTTPPVGGTGSEEFSPYVDMTLYPAFNFAGAAEAGIKDVTLAFIVSGTGNQPMWGGVYSLTDPYITGEIAAMHSAGISPTISFGGASGVPLAYTASNPTALAAEYQSVVNTYGVHKLDFDVEGAEQGDVAVLTNQAQAAHLLQVQDAATGHPVEISYTIPVLPTGLTYDGLQVLQVAIKNGVDIGQVNIMAMDYGGSTGSGTMGTAAIDAADSVHSQLMTLYPSMSSQQAWSMIGVTPMIGVNDDTAEVFSLADAQQLTTFAEQNHIGELSMWSAGRDEPGQLGVVSPTSSGVAQTAYEYSGIFDKFGS